MSSEGKVQRDRRTRIWKALRHGQVELEPALETVAKYLLKHRHVPTYVFYPKLKEKGVGKKGDCIGCDEAVPEMRMTMANDTEFKFCALCFGLMIRRARQMMAVGDGEQWSAK